MMYGKMLSLMVGGTLLVGPLVGCEALPEDRRQRGAVIGGAGGAAAGAVLAEDRLLGALIGGALGAGGGYLIGAEMNKIEENAREDALEAHRRAQENPARAEDARGARDADLNNDGFVTLDEVIAMQQAGLSDDEMIQMLDRTDQIFELTPQQEQQLRQAGVSDRVLVEMRHLNREQIQPAAAREPPAGTIGQQP
jgi:hypothetical protein